MFNYCSQGFLVQDPEKTDSCPVLGTHCGNKLDNNPEAMTFYHIYVLNSVGMSGIGQAENIQGPHPKLSCCCCCFYQSYMSNLNLILNIFSYINTSVVRLLRAYKIIRETVLGPILKTHLQLSCILMAQLLPCKVPSS